MFSWSRILTDEVGSFKRIWSLDHLSSKQLIWKAWPGPRIRLKVVALSSPHLGGLRFNRFQTTRISGKNPLIFYAKSAWPKSHVDRQHMRRKIHWPYFCGAKRKPGVFWEKIAIFQLFTQVLWFGRCCPCHILVHSIRFSVDQVPRAPRPAASNAATQRWMDAADAARYARYAACMVFLPQFNIAPEKLLAQKGK